MKKKQPPEDGMAYREMAELLLELVGRFSEGASIEEVMLGLTPPISKRSLQRWLSSLVEEGRLVVVGRGRATRYQLRETATDETAPSLIHSAIPLSKGAKEILEAVSRPISARHPVTYNREFLESYRPNHSYYLSESLRKRLSDMGESKDGHYPAGTYARQIFNKLLIDLSWNSSRLEGNTYSLLETEQLLERGKITKGKDLSETQMILNHKAAIEFLIQTAEEIGVNRFTILNLHTLLSDNLLPDPSACGRLRSIAVGIAHSTYQPVAIPQVVEECFDLLISKACKIKNPFEQAFFLMVQLPYLQPFDDVNKRTSRLATNIPLIQHNLCPLSFINVPQEIYINGLLGIYELNRIDLLRDLFVWAYQQSCAFYSTTRKMLGEPDPFRMKYRAAIQQVVREVVLEKMNQKQAVATIRQEAASLAPEEQLRFIEVVERELRSLHGGNIARYGLRPKEYEGWKSSWW